MLYTFAVLRYPLKAVPDSSACYRNYFGGRLSVSGIPDTGRFARVLTLDLRDPQLAFLRFPIGDELPLLMDFAEGAIAYSIKPEGVIQLHSSLDSNEESLLEENELPEQSIRLDPIAYEQYRAAIFSAAVIDDSYLSEEDAVALSSLGDNLTQIGGRQIRGSSYSPYCTNPSCEGHGSLITQSLVTIGQEPVPQVSFGFLPYDPAIEYSFCMSCHSISGVIVPD